MKLPYAQLLVAQLAVGAAALFARLALEGATPMAIAALRLSIATGFVGLVWRGKRTDPRAGRAELALVFAGVMLALHFVTWITSLLYLPVAVATLLVCTTPLWTVLFETWALRRPAPPMFWSALTCAAAGLWLILGAEADSRVPMPGHAAWGAFLAWLGSMTIGSYFLIVEAVGQDTSHWRAYSTPAIIRRTYAWAALACVIVSVAQAEHVPPLENHRAWVGVLGLAFVSQLIGHTLLNHTVRFFRPSIIAFATLLEPIFAALLAAMFLGEELSSRVMAGGAVVFAGVVAALFGAHRRVDRGHVAAEATTL